MSRASDFKPNDFVITCKLLGTLSSDFEPLKMAWCARPNRQRRSTKFSLNILPANSSLGEVQNGAAKFNKMGKQY